jgi:hypothetical protein
MFGLDTNKGTTCEETKNILREHAYNNYEKVIKVNLLNKGKENRYIKGHKGRTIDKLSEQTKRVLLNNLKR